jgi:hypothetical protein
MEQTKSLTPPKTTKTKQRELEATLEARKRELYPELYANKEGPVTKTPKPRGLPKITPELSTKYPESQLPDVPPGMTKSQWVRTLDPVERSVYEMEKQLKIRDQMFFQDWDTTLYDGGPGSGNYGHAGRPGIQGGSAKNSGRSMKKKWSIKTIAKALGITIVAAAGVYGVYKIAGADPSMTDPNALAKMEAKGTITSIQNSNLTPEQKATVQKMADDYQAKYKHNDTKIYISPTRWGELEYADGATFTSGEFAKPGELNSTIVMYEGVFAPGYERDDGYTVEVPGVPYWKLAYQHELTHTTVWSDGTHTKMSELSDKWGDWSLDNVALSKENMAFWNKGTKICDDYRASIKGDDVPFSWYAVQSEYRAEFFAEAITMSSISPGTSAGADKLFRLFEREFKF